MSRPGCGQGNEIHDRSAKFGKLSPSPFTISNSLLFKNSESDDSNRWLTFKTQQQEKEVNVSQPANSIRQIKLHGNETLVNRINAILGAYKNEHIRDIDVCDSDDDGDNSDEDEDEEDDDDDDNEMEDIDVAENGTETHLYTIREEHAMISPTKFLLNKINFVESPLDQNKTLWNIYLIIYPFLITVCIH